MKTKRLLMSGAAVFLILSAASASAHDSGHQHRDRDNDRYDDRREHRYYAAPKPRHHYYTRSNKMPRWLKKHREFKSWYKQTRFKRNRSLSWNRLYDIYAWERRHHRYLKHYW